MKTITNAPITYCTDFHLGKKLREHTNSYSQKAMMQHIYDRALSIVKNAEGPVINLGDLFDQYSNSEEIILQGIEVARHCALVLQGNHDVKNVDGLASSLDLVQEALGSDLQAVVKGSGHAYYEVHVVQGVPHYMVPHHFTQGEFEKCLRKACDDAAERQAASVLCLHCNVGDGYGEEIDPDGTSLYLTSKLQKLVVSHFKWVLVGHEHIPRTIRPIKDSNAGTIQILGNHFPMGFGEIEDRFVWNLDPATMKLTKRRVFCSDDERVELPVEELLDSGGDYIFPDSVCFVDITGELDGQYRPDVGRHKLKLWRANPHVLAMRTNVDFADAEKVSRARSGESLIDTLRRNAEKAGHSKLLEMLLAEIQESDHENHSS